MVTDLLSSILQELGDAIHLPGLQPDSNNTCLIHFKKGVDVQIEMDKKGDALIVGIDLGDVPVGRYRENVFRELLKANGAPLPRIGVFGYSLQERHVVLFEMMPLEGISGKKVAELLPTLIDKALIFKDAITHGDLPTFVKSGTPVSSNIFGIR